MSVVVKHIADGDLSAGRIGIDRGHEGVLRFLNRNQMDAVLRRCDADDYAMIISKVIGGVTMSR